MSTPAPLSQRSDMVVFLNGKFVPANQAHVGVMTHALAYGTGCFEGIRAYWNDQVGENYIFRAREHFERLHRSCRITMTSLPHSVDELIDIAVELVRRNDLHENTYIRPFAYKSTEEIGVRLHDLDDNFTMYAVPMGDYVRTDGMRCGVSSWRRLDDNMIPARAKIAGAYVNSAFAKSEAKLNGFDEAIMLTGEGHVSEGSAENIFLMLNNELVTPSPTENILLGITRETMIELARRELERITRERQIDRTELYVADEIFLTGTGAQIAPVVEVDHRPIGNGEIGPVTDQLQRLYADVVRGRRPDYMHWLTPVFAGTRAKPVATAGNGHKSAGNGHKSGRAGTSRRSPAGTTRV